MPEVSNPTTVVDPHSATNAWDNAPGGDLSFDELFPATEGQPTTATAEQPQEASQPPATPPAEKEEFFFKAGDSVYKSREALEQGIVHKDSLIAQAKAVRERLISKGIDPETGEPLKAPTRGEKKSYLEDEGRYAQDYTEALRKNDLRSWRDTQVQLTNEVVQQILGPIGPLVQNLAKRTAIESESANHSDLAAFVASPSYNETIDTIPVLKEAISRAEGDLRLSNSLPELYRTAYLVHRGLHITDPQKAPQIVASPQSAQPARPTVSGSAAPPVTPSRATAPDFSTVEGRRAIIERALSSGALDTRF